MHAGGRPRCRQHMRDAKAEPKQTAGVRSRAHTRWRMHDCCSAAAGCIMRIPTQTMVALSHITNINPTPTMWLLLLQRQRGKRGSSDGGATPAAAETPAKSAKSPQRKRAKSSGDGTAGARGGAQTPPQAEPHNTAAPAATPKARAASGKRREGAGAATRAPSERRTPRRCAAASTSCMHVSLHAGGACARGASGSVALALLGQPLGPRHNNAAALLQSKVK